MPIDNVINEVEKRVYTVCRGVMTLEDFKEYINRIWGDARCYGFNELFDTRPADWSEFDFANLFVVAKSAAQSGTIDPNTKLAWVVLEGKQKALTDFYKNIKAMLPVNSRELQAFYSEEEALKWLES